MRLPDWGREARGTHDATTGHPRALDVRSRGGFEDRHPGERTRINQWPLVSVRVRIPPSNPQARLRRPLRGRVHRPTRREVTSWIPEAATGRHPHRITFGDPTEDSWTCRSCPPYSARDSDPQPRDSTGPTVDRPWRGPIIGRGVCRPWRARADADRTRGPVPRDAHVPAEDDRHRPVRGGRSGERGRHNAPRGGHDDGRDGPRPRGGGHRPRLDQHAHRNVGVEVGVLHATGPRRDDPVRHDHRRPAGSVDGAGGGQSRPAVRPDG